MGDLYEVEKKEVEAAIASVQNLGWPIRHYRFDDQLGQWVVSGHLDALDSKTFYEFVDRFALHEVYLAGWRVEPGVDASGVQVIKFYLRMYVNH